MKPVRALVVLLLLILGCDETASKPYSAAAQQKRRDNLEANSGYVFVYSGQIGASFYHLRADCPKLDGDMKSSLRGKKSIKVEFRGGKIVDDQGFFYEAIHCDRCCP